YLIKLFLFMVVVILCFSSLGYGTTTYYVSSSTGNDAWTGTIAEPNGSDGPWATLTKARTVVRELILSGLTDSVTINVRGGWYYYWLSQPFTLDSQDSGTADYEVTWQAYPGETPVVSGGIVTWGWETHSGPILKTDRPTPTWWGRHLFVNNVRQTRARTPNYNPNDPLYGSYSISEGQGTNAYYLKYADGLFPEQLAEPNQAEIFCFVGGPNASWGSWWANVVSINYGTREIETNHNDYGYCANTRFRVENDVNLIDQAGEWCINPHIS
ncbi:MAG: hypothetical protein ABIG61_16965, partial [Planctomycetota bacterium]